MGLSKPIGDIMSDGVLFKPASKKQEMFIQSQCFRTVYGGSAGGGKAQPLYSKVLTPQGWKTMGDIQVGDDVLTHKNTTAKVLAVYPHEDKDIFELTTSGGRQVRACNEHLWKVGIVPTNSPMFFKVCDTDSIIEYLDEGYRVYVPCCLSNQEGNIEGQYLHEEIISVEYVGKEDAKCIYIDDPEHLYVTDDYIVTHNTYMGLMRFLLYVDDPDFIGFVLRKSAVDLRGAGGAFNEAIEMYSKFDPNLKYTKQPMEIRFSSGAKIYFTGLDGDAGMKSLQGKQISAAMLDEATHFTEEEIVWVESRLRTKADMVPNIWLTCNPDMDSVIFQWIKDFYLYPKGAVIEGELVEGRAIPEKDGAVRFYLKVGNKTEWGETKEELIEKFGGRFPKDKTTGKTTASPKSFTFISATCLDNPPLLEANPDYVSTLAALPRITRERLLFGNWLAREEGSGYFKRQWTPQVRLDEYLKGDEIVKRVRAWDLASTLPSEAYPDPDYTVGVLIARTRAGYYIIEDMVRGRWRAGELEHMLVEQTQKDIEMYGYGCTGYLPVEPASAGKIQKHHFSRVFAEARVPIKFFKVGSGKSKLDRFLPFASVAENGLTLIKEDDWNEDFLTELELFTGSRSKNHDDIVDATADAFNLLATTKELPKLNASLLKMR